MNAQEECLDRLLPEAIVAYHLYLKIVHSGMTARQVLDLPDKEFGQFIGEMFQITCDAGLVPYEKDFVPGLALSFSKGFTLSAVATEDIVSGLFSCREPVCRVQAHPPSSVLQGLPLCQFQLDGRTTRKVGMIPVKPSMSMADLMSLFKQPPLPDGSVMSLNPDISVCPVEECQEGVLPDVYHGLLYDDCESSMELARLAKKTSLSLFQRLNQGAQTGRADGLKKGCDGWKIFSNFTAASWDLSVRILDRGNAMLSAGHLKVMTAVGLATNASAAEELADTAEYCGHCFNVGILQTPGMPKPIPFLLEGTAPMYQVKVTEQSPRVTVHLFTDWDSNKPPTIKVMDMAEFLTALSSELLCLTQVINKPNGMGERKGGWPMTESISGWMTKTMVMSSLESDPTSHLSFYHRIVYMGMPCTQGGLGCMPMHEEQVGEKSVAAGCHPYELSNVQLRGLDASLPDDTVRLMSDVMNETTPPLAPPRTIQQLASSWIPCRPLEQVNTEVKREPGTFYRVVAMESPCAPEYLSIIHEAKRRLVEEANRLNSLKPDSDGIVLTAMIEGTSSLVCADVKNSSIPNLTVIKSVREALGNVGWNGFAQKQVGAGLKKGANQEEHPWHAEVSRHATIQKGRRARADARRREAADRQAAA